MNKETKQHPTISEAAEFTKRLGYDHVWVRNIWTRRYAVGAEHVFVRNGTPCRIRVDLEAFEEWACSYKRRRPYRSRTLR